jgi:hypothetical protein
MVGEVVEAHLGDQTVGVIVDGYTPEQMNWYHMKQCRKLVKKGVEKTRAWVVFDRSPGSGASWSFPSEVHMIQWMKQNGLLKHQGVHSVEAWEMEGVRQSGI